MIDESLPGPDAHPTVPDGVPLREQELAAAVRAGAALALATVASVMHTVAREADSMRRHGNEASANIGPALATVGDYLDEIVANGASALALQAIPHPPVRAAMAPAEPQPEPVPSGPVCVKPHGYDVSEHVNALAALFREEEGPRYAGSLQARHPDLVRILRALLAEAERPVPEAWRGPGCCG